MPRASRPRPAIQAFDASSGLSWNETTVKARAFRPLLNFRNQRYTPHCNALPGAPTLRDIATRTILRYSDHVTADSLAGLPFQGVGDKLWAELERLELTSPKLFEAFCTAFPDEEALPAYYSFAEVVPDKPISAYLDFLHSPERHYDVALTLSRLELARLDVWSLHSLTNFVALEIYTAPGEQPTLLDDHLLRSWARQVLESDSAWDGLRVLVLRNQRHVSPASLEQLGRFPSLTLLAVTGWDTYADVNAVARVAGWTDASTTPLFATLKREAKGGKAWDTALKACVLHSAPLAGAVTFTTPPSDESESQSQTKIQNQRQPLLSYRLGPAQRTTLFNDPEPTRLFIRRLEQNIVQKREPDTPLTDATDPPNSHGGPSQSRKRQVKRTAKRNVVDMLASFDDEGGAASKISRHASE